MKLLNEFIGTFFLVFTVGISVLEPHSAGAWAPLAIAAILTVMIYAGAHISGAHYNPAVSLAVFIRGQLKGLDLLGYWVIQMLAGLSASYVALYVKGSNAPLRLDSPVVHVFWGEFLFTFALCYVVLNVATAKETIGNSYFGVAIGGTVLAGALSIGAISGAAFNPSVALALAMINLSSWNQLWIYIVANLLGGAVAAVIFKITHSEKKF